jgi:soluble lytic murein transglycosylase-like protein
MWCESKGDPYDVGPQTRYGKAYGLMQILPDGSFDPVVNMEQAWAKYVGRGHTWSAWVCQ